MFDLGVFKPNQPATYYYTNNHISQKEWPSAPCELPVGFQDLTILLVNYSDILASQEDAKTLGDVLDLEINSYSKQPPFSLARGFMIYRGGIKVIVDAIKQNASTPPPHDVSPTSMAASDVSATIDHTPPNSKLRVIDLYYGLIDLRHYTLKWGPRKSVRFEIWRNGTDLEGSITAETGL